MLVRSSACKLTLLVSVQGEFALASNTRPTCTVICVDEPHVIVIFSRCACSHVKSLQENREKVRLLKNLLEDLDMNMEAVQ